ncbi:ESX secretion-associated protein EspG [Nocardia sp. 004]|uniref:ESX secretion-associated protein EspG n=1 Tax=Nocardia sp. 004 TaxID=3385978 RepID=UPI0039A129C6
MREWNWDSEDFAALWYSDANDRFPRPLNYRSRFTHENDFTTHRTEVRAGYSSDELEEIELALHTLSASQLRIEILGGTRKHKSGTGEVKEYRVVGARTYDHAVVLSQTVLGEQDGPIRVRLFRPESLAAFLVRSIPACAPGAEPQATFHADDLRPQQGGHRHSAARCTPYEQYQRLVHRQADGGGAAGLLIGPLLHRPEPAHTVQWYDITDDGRYTELTGRNISVRPTSPHDLAALFDTWIDRALRQIRDDEDALW